MKKKILSVLLILCLTLLIFTACAKTGANMEYDRAPASPPGDSGSELPDTENQGALSSADRKIIYSADVDLYTDNFKKTVAAVRSALKEDEWFDAENVSDGYAYFTARVKTARLNAFLDAITAESDSNHINRTATDISLSYQSKENRIAVLNEEKALLNAYAATLDKTPYEFITRIAQINAEITRLNRDIAEINSQIEYSTVYIKVHQNYTPAQIAYSKKASNTFTGAWVALSSFFKFLGLAAIALFPFVAVLGPIALGIVFLVLFLKRKKPFDKIPRKKNNRSKYGKIDINENHPYEKNDINENNPSYENTDTDKK